MRLIVRWSCATTLGIFLLPFLILLTTASESEETTKTEILFRTFRNKREGSWGEWTGWTPCSRTCGGGIRSQKRVCRKEVRRSSRSKSKEITDEKSSWKNVSNRYCDGHSSRHHICNTHECPKDAIDFRESQCKAFDTRMWMGKLWQWESFIDERSPCSLTCRAKGYRFLATLNKSVVDGTQCKSSPLLHVCVSGHCMPIGCDGIAGSRKQTDRCGVCGGDSTTCRIVSGIFTQPQLQVGYNMVAHIPRGACNVNITQIRHTPNYLALRKSDGSYILNGNWAISFSGEYHAAGTTFYYTRPGQDLKSLESISASGPLQEPVDLLVLYQQPNPGIKYEYILNDGSIPPVPSISDPLSASSSRMSHIRQPSPASYINPSMNSLNGSPNPANTISSFPKSSAHAVSNLYAGDSASAYNNGASQSGHPHLHNHHGRRRTHHQQQQNDKNPKFNWKITGYTNCTEACGGGTQRAIIRCVRDSNGATVSERRCEIGEKPRNQAVRCNLKPCPAEWVISPWSSCSEECGEGIQTRTIHCTQRVSPTLTMRVAEGACLEETPEATKPCLLKPCYKWETTEWSQCSARCGNGIRRRKIHCVDATGAKLELNKCDNTDKPVEITACNMDSCEGGADWLVSDWTSECSEKCGVGIQSRHVICSGTNSSNSDLQTNLIDGKDEDANEYCDSDKRPSEERECVTDRSCGEPVWFTGPWSECSVSCGVGVITRQVLCVLFSRGKFKIVDSTSCSSNQGSNKPEEKAPCDNIKPCPPRWFTSDWTECSVQCGGGTQKRSVSCRDSNWTKSSSLCIDGQRPIDKRSCNEEKCSSSDTTDDNGFVKDQNPPSSISDHSPDNASTRGVQNESPSHSVREHEEEVEVDGNECADQYRNCPLVVQARLCKYKYYRQVCSSSCRSCGES